MKKKTKKILGGILLALVIGVCGVGFYIYKKLHSSAFDIDETIYVYVDESMNYNNLVQQLEMAAGLKDVDMFNYLADAIKYKENMRTGRYAVNPGMTAKDLLRNLKNGVQVPVRITFNNIRLKSDFIERIAGQFMFTKRDLQLLLDDPEICKEYGFDESTILCMFIPNTYEMYWNTSPERFMKRMKTEYDRFWTDERKEKAANIPLSPVQVSILASITEEETAVPDEYPVVSGLYINRLKKGMLLQADPTVKYAVHDFTLKRILFKHLETESSYNTYKYGGLPPGPIRIPSIRGIDGVLNYTHHNYIYMCAKEDFSGRHNFATNLAEHNRNAARYQAALNRQGIK